jgi:hypothetical protein
LFRRGSEIRSGAGGGLTSYFLFESVFICHVHFTS